MGPDGDMVTVGVGTVEREIFYTHMYTCTYIHIMLIHHSSSVNLCQLINSEDFVTHYVLDYSHL